METNTYLGISGKARKMVNGYVGVDGVARKIKAAYIGVDGVARKIWPILPFNYTGIYTIISDTNNATVLRLETGGTFNINNFDSTMHITCVGGGQGGYVGAVSSEVGVGLGGWGGSGGQIIERTFTFSGSKSFTATIGSGGASGKDGGTTQFIESTNAFELQAAGSGGQSGGSPGQTGMQISDAGTGANGISIYGSPEKYGAGGGGGGVFYNTSHPIIAGASGGTTGGGHGKDDNVTTATQNASFYGSGGGGAYGGGTGGTGYKGTVLLYIPKFKMAEKILFDNGTLDSSLGGLKKLRDYGTWKISTDTVNQDSFSSLFFAIGPTSINNNWWIFDGGFNNAINTTGYSKLKLKMNTYNNASYISIGLSKTNTTDMSAWNYTLSPINSSNGYSEYEIPLDNLQGNYYLICRIGFQDNWSWDGRGAYINKIWMEEGVKL